MQLRLRASLLTATAAVTIALIAGCSSPATVDDEVEPVTAPAEQTVREACDEILGPIVKLDQQMQALEETAAEDPQSVVDGFSAAVIEISAVSASLGNAEVKSTLDTAIAALEGVTTSMQAIIDDPENADVAAFQESLTLLVDDFSAIDTVCGG